MAAYQAETKAQILQRMVNYVVSRSSLSDLTQTGGAYTLLAAIARAIERAQQGELALLDDTDLDKATGQDLVEIGKIYNISKTSALYATSTVVFSRTGTTGTVTIASGTQVRVPSATAGENLDYTTTAVGTILNGFTTSAAVAIKSADTGSKYNVAPAAISSFVSKPSGVDAVTNPNAITNGRDEQTDDEYREAIRNKIRSLSRSTVLGLEGAAQGVEDSVSGKTVRFVGVYEDEFWDKYDPTQPQVTVYIDDGNGTAESTWVNVGVAVLTATGGESDIYLPAKPIKPSATFTLYINALAVASANFWFTPERGHVKLSPTVYPDGLTAGDAVKADYTEFTGLIKEVQKVIDGDPADRSTYPGYRAGGIRVAVLAPNIVAQTVQGDVTILSGYDQATVLAMAEVVVAAYINNLSIGEDVLRAEIIERIMGVTGVYNLNLTRPAADVLIDERQIARVSSSAITLT